MGCDGGTIPRRDELVRTKKKPEQKDKNAETVAKWKHCAISQDPLHKPIVACELGRLYNKEAVIEHLLDKDNIPSSEIANHITKLSDVKELNLTEKNGFKAKRDHKGDEYVDFNYSRYICPVTGLDMNGKQRFYFQWKCGCVLSERAIKEVKSETCHKCGKPYDDNDTIVINGTDEEVEMLREKMIERRRLAKLEKKKKKASVTERAVEKNIQTDEVNGNIKGAPAKDGPLEKIKIEPLAKDGPLEKKIKIELPEASTSGIGKNIKPVNGVKVEKKVQNGKGTSKTAQLPEKAKKSYSIAKDPTASAAYKSLFTSHKSAINQEKAHWVTHNPLYF